MRCTRHSSRCAPSVRVSAGVRLNMKKRNAIILALVSSPSYSSGCSDMDGGDLMYQRFFDIAYEIGTVEGEKAFETRTPSEAEAIEGWQCIERAALIGNCSAIHIKELYYRHGVGSSDFGICQDTAKADHYLHLRQELCGK